MAGAFYPSTADTFDGASVQYHETNCFSFALISISGAHNLVFGRDGTEAYLGVWEHIPGQRESS